MYDGIKQLRSGLPLPFAIVRSGSYHPYHDHRASKSRNVSIFELSTKYTIGLSLNGRTTPLRSTANQSPRRKISVGGLPITPTAGPSRLMGQNPEGFSKHETETVDALRTGFGISRDDMDSLFEECDHCRQSFMRSALRVHIRQVEEMRSNDEAI